MTTHVMLDLETFSTAPDAAIVQIGAIQFDLEAKTWDYDAGFERTVTLQSSILAGGRVDPETIEWWRRQSTQARSSISWCLETGTLTSALDAFIKWFPKDTCLWSHGASFDVPVLESAFRSDGRAVPWDHRRVRDTRTLFELADHLAGWSRPKRETAHTAAADARDQAEDVRAAHAALRGLVGFNEVRAERPRTINLNDTVRVTLTAAGADAWRLRHNSEPPTYTNLQLPLWEIAHTFGAMLYNGSTQVPFESMELKVVP